jgi:hypothetical protein
MRNIGVVDAKLRLPDKHIAVPEIYQQIPVVCLETVLYSNHFEFLPILCDFSILHFCEQFYDFLSSVTLDLAPEQIIDIEYELLPLLFHLVEFGFLQEIAKTLNDDLMRRVLHIRLVEEVISQFEFGFHELDEGFCLLKLRTLLQQVLSPLDEHSPYSTGVELRLPVFSHLPHLRTGQNVVRQYQLHIALESVLLLYGLLQQKRKIRIKRLDVQIVNIRE